VSGGLAGARRFADGLERSVWTVAEGAGATGIYAGYQALPLPDVPVGYRALVIILLAGVLAGIKAAVAQRWGNGTAATLPAELENVPYIPRHAVGVDPAPVVVTPELGTEVSDDGWAADETTEGERP
jgi:hypothetical protein